MPVAAPIRLIPTTHPRQWRGSRWGTARSGIHSRMLVATDAKAYAQKATTTSHTVRPDEPQNISGNAMTANGMIDILRRPIVSTQRNAGMNRSRTAGDDGLDDQTGRAVARHREALQMTGRKVSIAYCGVICAKYRAPAHEGALEIAPAHDRLELLKHRHPGSQVLRR